MPDPRVKPVPGSDSSALDDASKLELYLQQQLEEDVARIFDESIYSDLELVCGKLKILTHSCILKARTKLFYSKLDAILHVNIGRDTFDEIYSFISDVYTECDIKTQEKEILIFLKSKITNTNNLSKNNNNKEESDKSEVFLTPNCPSPHKAPTFQDISCQSPSTEITKEYYALVHIEGNLLEQELNEQDALSDAFQTIIKSQDKDSLKSSQNSKPTSLSLFSSHSSEVIKHSNNCDKYKKNLQESTYLRNSKEPDKAVTCNQSTIFFVDSNKCAESENICENFLDPAYSPDSLITDDPSSSSDYISAVYTYSPALGTSGCLPHLNAGDNSMKMENIFTSSDSGLENTSLPENVSNSKDVTVADISFTENTLHDLTIEETNYSQESTSSLEPESSQGQKCIIPEARCSSSPFNTFCQDANSSGHKTRQSKSNDVGYGESSKEEKQRHNEEIVILESSSVSSETGSWESVFPPKVTDKEICDKFIRHERQFADQDAILETNKYEHISEHQNFGKLKTPCFIDAASLADEDQISVKTLNADEMQNIEINLENILVPSKPMPCPRINRLDTSPGDWSESNDNEDSLEQLDIRDHDPIQKDLSPTIFEMSSFTEDSLSTNNIQEDKEVFLVNNIGSCKDDKVNSLSSNTGYTSTPHNSIMSLKTSSLKHYESEENERHTITISRESLTNFRHSKFDESSPIVSGGTSIENNRTTKIGPQSSSPLVRRKVENIPIVTGACFTEECEILPKSPKSVSGSAWVVDMSRDVNPKVVDAPKSSFNQSIDNKKPSNKICEKLKNETKSDICNRSRESVDSDNGEKSGHKFYIDLSTLPNPLPTEESTNNENNIEKKNIFTMFIELRDSLIVKEMPTRSSSHNVKKRNNIQQQNILKKVNDDELNSTTEYTNDHNDGTTTFETYEALCNDPNINISEIIKKSNERESDKIINDNQGDEGKNVTPKTKEIINKEPINHASDLFVKLSDLDKPIQKSGIFEETSHHDARMTRSIPDTNWFEQNKRSTSHSSEIISSFHSENALSLNRLFPQLKNEFSKSMPISMQRSSAILRKEGSSSVVEIDEMVHDLPEINSIQSSMCRSIIENSTMEETSQTSSLISNCQSRLGQDLLRMFLEEIAPDVIVEVGTKRIKAHKCILSSRCQYFAAMLSGGWVERAGNVIILPPFTFNVMHFAMCHIYSGSSTIPDSINIVELATIADMLGLEGLKEAVIFTLKAKYCHNFHRPCCVCIAGVLECFSLSSVYGLDDLYRKCLRWITKYFTKIWPTKAFATLSKEVLDKFYLEHLVNLSTDNLIDTVYGCGIIVNCLENSRWAGSVAQMCRRLVNAAAQFAAPRLLAIFELVSTVPDAPNCAKQALDDCLAAAIEWAPPEETCRAYAYLSNLVREIRNQHAKPDLITNQIRIPEPSNVFYAQMSSWRLQCEGALVKAAPRVVVTQAFKDLPPDLRRRLRELGCIMYGTQTPVNNLSLQDRKTKSTYQNKPKQIINPVASWSLDMKKVRNAFVPYKPKPLGIGGSKEKIISNSELRENKKINIKNNVLKVRTTKAQEERAKFNQSKTLTSQDRSINNKPLAVRPHAFENTKPRYLEPRQCKEKEKKTPAKKLVNKMVSSSDSSRNSSPIQSRNLRTSRWTGIQVCEKKQHAMSQDSLATSSRPRTAEPSTDSLSESQNSNKYATYTKTKHNGKGSAELIPKSQLLSPSSLLNSNVRTKIPIYLNQNSVSCNGSSKSNNSAKGHIVSSTPKSKTRLCERKVSGSVMSATKSSSAKIVPKIIIESPGTKLCKQQKHATKRPTSSTHRNDPDHIPTIERSGTFLKDEPMFADKTTNIDKSH